MKGNLKKEYRRAFAINGAVIVAGILLQYTAGPFPKGLLAFPVNILFLAIIILAGAGLSFFRESRAYKALTGIPFTVSLITYLLLTCLVMGLVPQSKDAGNGPDGLTAITRSWPYVLLYAEIMLVLCAVTVKRARHFSVSDIPFYLNHLGLLAVLFSTGPGSADSATYFMQAHRGQLTDKAFDRAGHTYSLPFSVTLKEFILEYYPPKLAIIDPLTGKYLPVKKPQIEEVTGENINLTLDQWNIKIVTFLPQAVRDSTGILQEVNMPGASEAALILAQNASTGQERRGWVYRGNQMQEHSALSLSQNELLVFTPPEPKRYASEFIFSTAGRASSEITEVNRPFRDGHWSVYQQSYDTEAGRMSSYSVFQVVYDPWQKLTYGGLILIAAGCVTMLWSGKKKRTA